MGISSNSRWRQTGAVTAAGVAVDFTNIPTNARRVHLMFNYVSKSGTSQIIVQLGSAAGIETANYFGAAGVAGGSSSIAFSTGILVDPAGMAATDSCSGMITLVAHDSTGLNWGVMGMVSGGPGTIRPATMGGIKQMTGGAMNRLRITTAGGVDTFDAGSFSLNWEL